MMIERTRFDAIVTRPGWVRIRLGEYPCPEAADLPAGTRVTVTLCSDEAVIAGAEGTASFAGSNDRLAGNPWTGRGGRWDMTF